MRRRTNRLDVPGRVMILFALTAALGSATVRAGGPCTPPVNEDCDGAIPFGNADLPFSFSGILGCANDLIDRPYFDVFFQFDCTVTGDYVFDMCGSTGDTYMRIYIDGCGFGPASGWVVDDDGCGAVPEILDPRITMTMEAGRSYWIELGAWRDHVAFPPNANDRYMFLADVPAPPCPADCDEPADGVVGVTDLLELLAQWGTAGACDGDGGGVAVTDLLALLAAWGPC